MKNLLLALIMLTLTSCGPANVPDPTTKIAKASDVIGLWEYNDIYNRSKITIRFLPSGAFEQTVPMTPPIIQKGTWTLTGTTLNLSDVLLNIGDGKPSASSVNWYLIDDPYGSSDLRIFGGDIDNLNHWEDFKFLGK